MSTVVRVENLSKQYRLGTVGTGSLAHDLNRWWHRVRGNEDPYLKIGEENDRTRKGGSEYVWALRDVNFEVKDGEVLGIIGRNGAGKSTLLKILSRTTTPTTGCVKIKGRVASLLEVGTGFHPELTGRENVFLNGAILGMTRHEIARKFDEIVDFSGVERYIDTPVKRYSSGMHVRLAFAVAAHLEPEILIIDEVLAVGDSEFQKKCVGKMGEVSRQGRTVLFVSHNLPAVQRLCQRGIYLSSGTLVTIGNIYDVLNAYQRTTSSGWSNKVAEQSQLKNNEANFIKWELENSSIGIPHSCKSRDICKFKFTFYAKRKIQNARFGFSLQDHSDQRIIVAHSLELKGERLTLEAGMYELIWDMKLPLRAGTYQIVVGAANGDEGMIEEWYAQPFLSVLPNIQTHLPEQWHGLLNEQVEFQVQRVD